MKHTNTMTVSQFASMGGKARARKLSAKRKSEIGKMGARAAKASGKRLGRTPKAKATENETMRFGKDAEEFLEKFYLAYKVVSTPDKIDLLQKELGGGTFNFYGFGEGELTDDMKLACLEYDFLERKGKISLVLA